MTSFSTSNPVFSSFPSDPNPQTSQQTSHTTKILSMPSNSPSRSTENDSPVPAQPKENDDNTLVSENQLSTNLLDKPQNPSEKGLSQTKPINEKRMSKQDSEHPQNIEITSKKQRISAVKSKKINQTVEKPAKKEKKADKEPKKVKDRIKRPESVKGSKKKRKLDTDVPVEEEKELVTVVYDEEIQKKVKQCRKIRVGYSEERKQLNFTLDCLNQADMTTQTIELTRNEMLTYNPQLVLMFYEKNLEFPHMPDFNINALKQV